MILSEMQFLNGQNFDILFLQECYCSEDKQQDWDSEWGNKFIYSHGTNHSKGVMMLFSNKLDFKVLHERTDHEGRYIICKLEVNKEIGV